MIERMNDVIVWDGFPHPDPVMRHASATVQLAPPLWRRVLHHLTQRDGVQDAGQRAAQYAAWSTWLGETALVALRDALERELAHDAPRGDGAAAPALPADAIEAIRTTLCASFWQPLAIWFGSTESKSDGYYRLILTNGATAVLRPLPADPSSLLLEDLFFSQGKSRLEGDNARRLAAVAQATDRYATFLPHHRDAKRGGGTRRLPRPQPVRFVEPRIWNDLPAAPPPAASIPTPSESAEAIGLNRLLQSAGSNGLPAFSSEIATVAARELRDELETWTRSAGEIPNECDRATCAYREELCLGMLENRMSAWARFLAIDEAYANAMEMGQVDDDFATEVDAVLAAMEAFDEALQAGESFWAPIAARVELLNNWKNRLAAPHRHALPWWMSAAKPSGARARASSYLLG